MLDRAIRVLAAEDVTTVALLQACWSEVKDELRAAPRALCAKALAMPLRDDDSVNVDRVHLTMSGFPSFKGKSAASFLTRRKVTERIDRQALLRRQASKRDGGSQNSVTTDGVGHTKWRVGSSSAEVLTLAAANKDNWSKHGHAMRETRPMHFLEWRAGGYARHALSAKELLHYLHAVGNDATPDEEKSMVAARDLRQLDPSLARKSAKASLPFLMARQGAVLFAAADACLYAVVLSDCAFLFTPAKDAAVEGLLPRLEASRCSVMSAADIGHGEADPQSASVSHFGLHALEAILSEVCYMLHQRTDRLLAQTTRLGGGGSIDGDANSGGGGGGNGANGEDRADHGEKKGLLGGWTTDLQSQRDDVARLTLEQQHLSSGVEALMDDIKLALEKDSEVACLTAALGVPEADVEALLESRLHSLTDVSAGLDAVVLHLDLLNRGLHSRENHVRNRLLHFEVITSATSTGLAFGGVLAGVFGMNVSQQSWMFQDDSWGETFTAVCICVALGVVVLTLSIVGLLWREEIRHRMPKHGWGALARALPKHGHALGHGAINVIGGGRQLARKAVGALEPPRRRKSEGGSG